MIAALRGWRPSPRASLLLGVLAWAVALAAIFPIVHGYLTSPPDQRLVDLDVYRTGGLAVLQGQPLYSVLTQPPQLLPFTYPPLAAVFAVPLAMMSWPAAQLVWVAFVYVPFAVIIGFSFRPLLRRAGPWRWVLLAALFAAGAYLFPMQDEMRFGQVDAVLAALAVADCAAVRTRWPRGALVGLATGIKLVPGVFIIYLLVSGRRRAARTAVLAALAWTVGAFLLLPRDSVSYWTSVIFDSGRLGDNAGTENQSLRGLLLRFFLPGQAPGVIWVLIAVAVAVPGFLLARRLARQHWETAGIAVTALLLVLISPVAWIHYFLLVVVVIGALTGDGRRLRRVLTAAGTALFFGLKVPWWGQSLLHDAGVPRLVSRLVEGAYGIAAIVLIVIIARTRMTGADRQPAADGDDDGDDDGDGDEDRSPGAPAGNGDVDAFSRGGAGRAFGPAGHRAAQGAGAGGTAFGAPGPGGCVGRGDAAGAARR